MLERLLFIPRHLVDALKLFLIDTCAHPRLRGLILKWLGGEVRASYMDQHLHLGDNVYISAVAASLDIPYLLYCLGRDGDVAPASDYRLGVKTRWLLGDLKAFRGNLASAPSKARFLTEFFSPGAQFDELSLLDPLPFCALFADTVYRFLKGGFHMRPHESLRGEWT